MRIDIYHHQTRNQQKNQEKRRYAEGGEREIERDEPGTSSKERGRESCRACKSQELAIFKFWVKN